MKPRLRIRLRRGVLRHRRLLAAGFAGVAVAITLHLLVGQPGTASVVSPGVSGAAQADRSSESHGERLSRQHPGLVVVPIRLADAGAAALLEAGDLIVVRATDPNAEVATREVVPAEVLDLPAERAVSIGEQATGRLVIVGVGPDRAGELSDASVRTVLSFSWER